MEPTFTTADLDAASATLAAADLRVTNYKGKNPAKWVNEAKAARAKFWTIEKYLKDTGVIPLSEKEQLDLDLDRAFPKVWSGEIVKHNGTAYRLRFRPAAKFPAGKSVTAWERSWEQVQ